MSLSVLAIDYALFFKVWRAQWTVSLAYNAKLLVDSKEILRKKKRKRTQKDMRVLDSVIGMLPPSVLGSC